MMASRLDCCTCVLQPAQNTCQFRSSIPLALDDIDSLHYNGRFQIHLVQKFITSSVAVVLESFSFVFVSYTDINGSSFIAGVSIANTFLQLLANTSVYFDNNFVFWPV